MRFVFLLYAGFLSFICAEVVAASAPNWIISPWSLLVTFPLYLLNFLFFINLAVRTGRTTLPALYLWGILFGLYETWITKVVWAGYPGHDGFVFGGIAGFGLHETFALVLFFHALFSFLIPLSALCLLFPSVARDFGAVDWFFTTDKPARLRRYGLLLLMGITGGHILHTPQVFLMTWIPSLCFMGLGYIWLRRHYSENFTLVLGRKAFLSLGFVLGLIYLVLYLYLRPNVLPTWPVQLATIGLYATIGALIYTKRATTSTIVTPLSSMATPNPKQPAWSLVFLFGITGLSMMFTLVMPDFMAMVAQIIYALLIPVGLVFFVKLGLRMKPDIPSEKSSI